MKIAFNIFMAIAVIAELAAFFAFAYGIHYSTHVIIDAKMSAICTLGNIATLLLTLVTCEKWWKTNSLISE